MKRILWLFLLITTSVSADLDKAVEFTEQGKYTEAKFELLEIVRAAKAGDAKSQLEFGLMWDKGYWLWQDDERAVKWWKKSAEQGYTQAQMLMGSVYLGGVKVEKDLKKADEWFDMAIESDATVIDAVNALKAFAISIQQKEKK